MSRDRTAIVTGAGSPRGIGREACLRLAAAGWSIAALDLDEAAARETAALVSDANGGQVIGLGCDVTKSGQVDAAVSASSATCRRSRRSSTTPASRRRLASSTSMRRSGTASSTSMFAEHISSPAASCPA